MINSNKQITLLTDLANKYLTDKGSGYKCAHNYTKHYEHIIDFYSNKLLKTNINLLEIGLNRDNQNDIPSLKMWNDYFNSNIRIFWFDINSTFLNFNNKYSNIKIYSGNQSISDDLLQLKNNLYTIIIDDGSHASKDQQISFKELWNSVESKGCYIIENLHWQPTNEITTKTKELLLNWTNGNFIHSEFINLTEVNLIKSSIDKICFYNSESKLHNSINLINSFVVIYKK